MSIGDEVGHSFTLNKHLLEDDPMFIRRVDQTSRWLIQPALNPPDSIFQSERLLENPAVGANPDERRNDRPAEAYLSGTGEPGIPPFPGPGVLRAQTVFGIKQDIGVNQNQRKSSPSA